MDAIAKADIFFVVTTVAVVAVAVGVIVVLVQVYAIAKDIRSVTEKIAASGDALASDIAAVRASIKRGIQKIFARMAGFGEKAGARRRNGAKQKKKELSDNQ